MWREYTDTGSGTQSKDTTVYAGNNRASYKWTTGGSASNWSIFQYIETSNCLHMVNKKVTLSFWAATSTSRSLAAIVSYNTGIDTGWPNSFTTIDTLNFTTSSSLQLFSLTVTVPSNAKTLQVAFNVGSGGNFAAGVTVNITGVQLEIGTAPSEYEFEPFETTFRKCQRYFCKSTPITQTTFTTLAADSNMNSGCCWITSSTNGGGVRIPFPVQMRAVPTVDFRAWTSVNDNISNGGSFTTHAPGLGDLTSILEFKSESGLSIYTTSVGYRSFFFWRASAEL
jgi:hypothetical protein